MMCCCQFCSKSAFKFNLRRYAMDQGTFHRRVFCQMTKIIPARYNHLHLDLPSYDKVRQSVTSKSKSKKH